METKDDLLAVKIDLEDIKSTDFVKMLCDNVKSLNQKGLAQWKIDNKGYPTLDFRITWNGTEWIESY